MDYIKEMLEKMKTVELTNINLPCNLCKGDCCGASNLFTTDELKVLKKKHKSKFKKLSIIKSEIPTSFTIKFKGVDIDLIEDKCVFLVNGACSIYEDRPEVCKDYGVKKYIPCPYNHLDNKPESKEEQIELTLKSQKAGYGFIQDYISLIKTPTQSSEMTPIAIEVSTARNEMLRQHATELFKHITV